jgi:hypothetical protein
MPYLTVVNDDFKNAVSRTFGYQTGPMKAAILAVANFQRIPNAMQLRFLEVALAEWQRTNPVEFNNRMSNIRDAFNAEMAVQRVALTPAPAPANNMNWVAAVSGRLDEFKQYAVGDILAFILNSVPASRQDCLARYSDFAHADPEPARLGPRVGGVMFGTAWNANRARMMDAYVTYAAQRNVLYTPSADIGHTPATGAGPVRILSRGCAVCTEFAFAAAHVLTDGRPGGPRVEVVSWAGHAQAAHCYVLVGRHGPAPVRNRLLPGTPANWGADCVIVDAWLAALGHKVAYRLNAGDYPEPGFLNPVSIVMAQP